MNAEQEEVAPDESPGIEHLAQMLELLGERVESVTKLTGCKCGCGHAAVTLEGPNLIVSIAMRATRAEVATTLLASGFLMLQHEASS